MRPLFVSSTGSLAGQTLVAWLLLRELKARGGNPGFYKPLGHADPETGTDPDVALFPGLFGLRESNDQLCPYTVEAYQDRAHQFEREQFLALVDRRFRELSGAHDRLVVVGSSDIFVKPDFVGLPDGKFIELLDARVVLVDSFQSESHTVYSALSVGSFLRHRLAALIVNRVPADAADPLRAKLSPLSRQLGPGMIAVVPEDRVLASFLVDDYVRLLRGNVLAAGDRLDRLVCQTTIGSEPLPPNLRLLRRVYNKILLLGGTAGELTDAAFVPQVVGVLVTGGRTPPDAVVQAAAGADVPLVTVQADSFAFLERLQQGRFQILPAHAFKVDRLAHLLAGQLDMERLLAET